MIAYPTLSPNLFLAATLRTHLVSAEHDADIVTGAAIVVRNCLVQRHRENAAGRQLHAQQGRGGGGGRGARADRGYVLAVDRVRLWPVCRCSLACESSPRRN